MERKTQFNVGYMLFALLAVVMLQQWWQRIQTVEVVPYSEFERLLAEEKIAEVTVSDQHITGKLKVPDSKGKTVAVANLVPPEIAQRLEKYGVKYTRVNESTFLRDLLSWVLPALVFFGVWFLLARRMASQQGLGGGFMNIGFVGIADAGWSRLIRSTRGCSTTLRVARAWRAGPVTRSLTSVSQLTARSGLGPTHRRIRTSIRSAPSPRSRS